MPLPCRKHEVTKPVMKKIHISSYFLLDKWIKIGHWRNSSGYLGVASSVAYWDDWVLVPRLFCACFIECILLTFQYLQLVAKTFYCQPWYVLTGNHYSHWWGPLHFPSKIKILKSYFTNPYKPWLLEKEYTPKIFFCLLSSGLSEELHRIEANQKLRLLLSQQMVPEEQQKKLSAS